MDNPRIANLKVLIPRILLLVRTKPNAERRRHREALRKRSKRGRWKCASLARELKKVGGDMFIFLALENMRIYLVGGVLLALIAILAIALDQLFGRPPDFGFAACARRLAGAAISIFRLEPVGAGAARLVVGLLVALAAGFGLTNLIWSLRELKSVVHLLPTHLVVSDWTVWISLGLLAVVVTIALLFSLWVFRRSARTSMLEG